MFEPKHDPQEVLHSTFDFDVHNETFRNYCEVVIDSDGVISYAVPSHIDCLRRMYRERMRSDPDDDCPRNMYGDYLGWLSEKLEACVVYTGMFGRFYNDAQRRQLMRLQMHGCCSFDRSMLHMLGKKEMQGR